MTILLWTSFFLFSILWVKLMTTGRLPPWLKISLAAFSGPTPSRQPTVPGSSQLVKHFIIFFWSRSWHLLFQILFAVNKDSGAMEGYIAPYNEYYMVILSQPDHNILSRLLQDCATFLPVNHCTASYQHCSRLPTLPTWPALQAARQRNILPPSWASGCHGQPSNEFCSHFFLSPATARPPVPTVTRSPSPMRASPCSLTTTTTTSWAASYPKYLWIRSGNPHKFVPQFNYYLTRGCQTNPFQLQLISDWMQADKLFWR